MKDFPIFTTEFGAASLTMKQIPYRKEAYIHLQDFLPENRENLISECASFCRLAGAEKVYVTPASAEPEIRILEMRGVPSLDFEQVQNIFPVTETTVGKWRSLANERLRQVDLAAMLEKRTRKPFFLPAALILSTAPGSFWGLAGWRGRH